MNRLTAKSPGRLDRLVEGSAGLVVLLLYWLLVSRGEFLPYTGLLRTLTAPLVGLLLLGLVGWRLRSWRPGWGWLRQAWLMRLALVGLGSLLVLLAGRPTVPAEPDELAVLHAALRIISNSPAGLTEPSQLGLAWLHAPLMAGRYVSGVSAGLWQFLRQVPPEAALPWSRSLHLGLIALCLWWSGDASGRLGGPWSERLTLLLLAVSGPWLLSGLRLDPLAPLALLAAWLSLMVTLSRPARRLAGRLGQWRGGPLTGLLALCLLVAATILAQQTALIGLVPPLAAILAGVTLAPLIAWRFD
jgi:hypothetical protein